MSELTIAIFVLSEKWQSVTLSNPRACGRLKLWTYEEGERLLELGYLLLRE
jgi:hypothetical protein